jgi:YbbR domain-containing protein
MDKWLRNKNVVRVIALGLGILLWAMTRLDSPDPAGNAASGLRYFDIRDVKIRVEGLDEDLYHLKLIEPSAVQIRVQGRENVIRRIKPEQYKITLNLSQATEGIHSLPLVYDLPSGIQMVEMYPSRVTVHIERMETKEMDVTIRTEGTPAEGYKAGEPIVDTQRVHVTLPESQLDLVQSVEAVVDIDGLDEPVREKRVRLAALDREGKVISTARINPAVVEVEIPITRPFKTVPLQVKYVGHTPDGISISEVRPSVEQVTLYAPQEVLDEIEFFDGLEVDLSQITASTTLSLPLAANQPIERIEPSEVKLEFTVTESELRTFDRVPVKMSGKNDQYVTKVIFPENGYISVTVEGAPERLKGLNVNDIQAVADVSDLPPGTHRIRLQMTLPLFLKATSPQYWADIEITAPTEPGVSEPATAEMDLEGDGDDANAGGSGENGSGDASGSGPPAGDAPSAPGDDGEEPVDSAPADESPPDEDHSTEEP